MKIVVVYLGDQSLTNFAHSSQTGVWGFRANRQPEEEFSPGDTLFFAAGYTGKNIRLPEEKWLPHHITLAATAEIASPLKPGNNTPHWPDEVAENKVHYPQRFTFTNLQRKDGRFALNDGNTFPLELSLAIRKAAIGGKALDEEVTPAEVPALDLDQTFFKPEFTCLNDVLSKHREKAKEIAAFIEELNGELASAGFEVGYRVRDEAISFAAYATEAGLTKADVNEAIVLQKILPRIQGSSPRVGKLLHSLLQKLKGDVDAPQLEDPNFDQRLAELRSDGNASSIVRKIAGMLLIFREENFTSFWLV